MTAKFYIVATYIKSIRDPKFSSTPGIFDNNKAWRDNEQIRCTKNLKTKDLTESSIILDVASQTVFKNRFDQTKTFEELYAYYLEHFGDYINEWLEKQIAADGK